MLSIGLDLRTLHGVTAPALSISVVIPTLDEGDRIGDALVVARAPGVERIVVDGSSTDDTRERARAAGAEQVLEAPRGRAAQMERGRCAAKGDVVLFLHADTQLEPGWDAAVRRALQPPSVAGGAFRLAFTSTRSIFRWLERGAAARARLFGLPYGDQALFIRSAILERAGGVPQTPLFEDLDLARLIRRTGRLALLDEPAWTSARRYERNGVLRTAMRNNLALTAWALGLPRESVARWYGARARR